MPFYLSTLSRSLAHFARPPRSPLPPPLLPSPPSLSLLFDAGGLSRGHFYVNGHDLGRYFLFPGQDNTRYYYVPMDTLNPPGHPNTIVVIDELGAPSLATVNLVLSSLAVPDPGMACPV